MGVDLGAIIQHNLTKQEILKMPQEIDSWQNIREFKKSSLNDLEYNSEHYMKYVNSKSKWSEEGNPTAEILETIWNYKESEKSLCSINPFQNQIDTFFGEIIFYRNLALICQSPEHKYGNLLYPKIAHNIISINRKIAEKFNASKLVYCPDSGFPTELVWHESGKYHEIEDLIRERKSRFFEPPKILSEAIKYYYFVDDFSDNELKFQKWTWQDSPWVYNEEKHKYEYKAYS